MEQPTNITFLNQRYVFQDETTQKKIIFRGLGPLLREFFWSDYDYHAATSKMSATLKKVRESTIRRDPLLYAKGVGGQEVGKKVHDQLEDIILQLESINVQHLLSNPLLHPYVPRIIALIGKMGWQAVATEYLVYEREVKLATKIDLVCRRVDYPSTLILVELKIGYPSVSWNLGNAQIYPFEELCPNSPFHQACLQLMMGAEMFKRTAPSIWRNLELWTIHAAQDGISADPVPRYLLDVSAELFEMMIRACKKNYYLGRPKAREALSDEKKKHAKGTKKKKR